MANPPQGRIPLVKPQFTTFRAFVASIVFYFFRGVIEGLECARIGVSANGTNRHEWRRQRMIRMYANLLFHSRTFVSFADLKIRVHSRHSPTRYNTCEAAYSG